MKENIRPKFLVIKLATCRNKKIFHTWKKKLFHKYYCNKMLQKLPHKEKIITVLGVSGVQIELPFMKEQAEKIDTVFLEQYINKLKEQYGLNSCYLDRELYFMRKYVGSPKDWIFRYILFGKGIEKFFNQYGIKKKDTRFVVIDGGTQKIELVLQYLIPAANYMTIVTKRPAFFNNAVDEVLEATGLLMQVLSEPVTEIIHGNVLVFLGGSSISLYNKVEEGAYVVDLDFEERKFEYILSRRKDLTILYDFEIDFNGENIDKGFAAEVMTKDNWKLDRFAEKAGISLLPAEMEQLAETYRLDVKSMKILQPYKSILD